jgi:signal peptidase I
VVVAALVRALVAEPFAIPSGSMRETLRPHDRVLVDKLSYRLGAVRRGDVVVFDGVDSFTAAGPPGPAASATYFVKRVTGLPGDRVRCCDARGRMTVNGAAVEESAYLYPGDAPSEVEFDVRVPAGRLWVMGDHRAASADSRAHLGDPGGGTVAVHRVVGRVVAVVWPLDRIGGVPGPDAAARVGSPDRGATAAAPYALAIGAVFPHVWARRRRRGATRGYGR